MDISKLRNETPGTKNVIHFNNAGAALVSRSTLKAQQSFLNEEAEFGGYETAAKYHDELEEFYVEVAWLIKADPNEIAFAESATVAWQRAFFSIPFRPGDVILTGQSEYASNYISFLVAKEKFGVEIVNIPSTSQGGMDVNELEKNITSRTKLIAMTHIPTNGGLVNPAEEVGKVAKKHDVLYLLDACQSAGQYPLDVNKLHCDFLSATGRKYLRGPRGTAFLYVKKELINNLTPPSLDLHGAEWVETYKYVSEKNARKFETWESSFAAKYGFVNAIKELNQLDISVVWQRVCSLADYLRSELEKLDSITVQDIGEVKSGIVTFSSSSVPTEELKLLLSEKNINTSISKPSGTLLDSKNRNLKSMIRASVHYYNTHQEIDTFVNVLKEAL